MRTELVTVTGLAIAVALGATAITSSTTIGAAG